MCAEMKTKPIIFNGEMVRAILDERKTQTRRVVKPQPRTYTAFHRFLKYLKWKVIDAEYFAAKIFMIPLCPYGRVGDRLWVRETWFPMQDIKACAVEGEPIEIVYKADWDADGISRDEARDVGVDRWRPSIFMPRWASRITLEITNVRVEQVQDISGKDAIAEGWPQHLELFPTINAESKARIWFWSVWNSINAKRGFDWDINPWAWVVEFQRTNSIL